MSLEGIEVFVEVVNAQSFSRAAARLGMPTTTVSAKIARLEKRLGVTLLQRTTRQLNVTDAGRAYYERCARALAEVTEAERALADGSGEPSGTLQLTVPPDIASSLLPPIVDAYLERYPKVSVNLRVTNRVVDLIQEGIDLGIRVGTIDNFSLVIRKFISGRMRFWASPDYVQRYGIPQTPDDLSSHHLIRFLPAPDRFSLFTDDGGSAEFTFASRLICDDIQTCRTYIEQGTGIGLLPEFFVNEASTFPALIPVLPAYGTQVTAAYFVYPSQTFVPQTVRTFIETAVEIRRG